MKKYTKRERQILYECRKILKEYPKLKKRKLYRIKDLEKRLYYYKVWSITESQPLHKLRNHDKRCFRGSSCYHLDHKCSIARGFIEGIPPEVIGNISNLKFIPWKENMDKGHKVSNYILSETKKKVKRFNSKGKR